MTIECVGGQRRNGRRLGSIWALAALLCWGCGGSQTPAANASDPPLEDAPSAKPAASVPASSAKVQQGIDAIQKQDFKAAQAVLTEARAEAPKDPQAAFYLGVALEGAGSPDLAEKEYRAALELDPKLVDATANLSALLVDAGKTREALPIIEQGLKAAPKHPELLVNRAICLEAEGRDDVALQAYAAALEVRADAPDLHLAYAKLLAKAGKNPEAIEQLRAASAAEAPEVLSAIADLFGKLKAPADCVALMDRVLKAQPSPYFFVRRGACRHDASDESGARADFEAALKLEPRFAPAHYYLGMHFVTKQDKKAATQHLTQAIQIDGEQGSVGKRAKKALQDLKGAR
ncbi:MAG TPA: tetratricopeptide repeat protein [Polyangiaceae bacterium]|nr:tetratricopeptide repeat protein [Polyangiaceae bacterium]